MTNQFNQSSRIRELKGRVERCCCRYCGSPLELKRITFSHFEDSRIEIFAASVDGLSMVWSRKFI